MYGMYSMLGVVIGLFIYINGLVWQGKTFLLSAHSRYEYDLPTYLPDFDVPAASDQPA